MCVVIFPSLQGKSYFGVVLAIIDAACLLPSLYPIGALAKSVLEGAEPPKHSVGAVVASLAYHERGHAASGLKQPIWLHGSQV